jgi:hypothetical protein
MDCKHGVSRDGYCEGCYGKAPEAPAEIQATAEDVQKWLSERGMVAVLTTPSAEQVACGLDAMPENLQCVTGSEVVKVYRAMIQAARETSK